MSTQVAPGPYWSAVKSRRGLVAVACLLTVGWEDIGRAGSWNGGRADRPTAGRADIGRAGSRGLEVTRRSCTSGTVPTPGDV